MKQYVQAFLRSVGLYHRFKGSLLYDLYWSIMDRSVIDSERKEVQFYRCLLRGFKPGGCIVDIGANHGSKTRIFLRLGARVVAADPDDVNTEILRGVFLRYRLKPAPVIVQEAAVSDKCSTATLWIDEPGFAKEYADYKVGCRIAA